MSDYEENPMYCKHLKGFDEDGDCKDCALESIYCAEQLSMRNVRLEDKVAELEKENAKLKDTNFMVENFHKLGLENEALKAKVEGFRSTILFLRSKLRQMDRPNHMVINRECLDAINLTMKEANADE
jgi:hypothetical protein